MTLLISQRLCAYGAVHFSKPVCVRRCSFLKACVRRALFISQSLSVRTALFISQSLCAYGAIHFSKPVCVQRCSFLKACVRTALFISQILCAYGAVHFSKPVCVYLGVRTCEVFLCYVTIMSILGDPGAVSEGGRQSQNWREKIRRAKSTKEK